LLVPVSISFWRLAGASLPNERFAGRLRPDVIAPLEARQIDRRVTTDKLLPRMLELKEKGLNYRKIAEELGVTKRVVEPVMARRRAKSQD